MRRGTVRVKRRSQGRERVNFKVKEFKSNYVGERNMVEKTPLEILQKRYDLEDRWVKKLKTEPERHTCFYIRKGRTAEEKGRKIICLVGDESVVIKDVKPSP